MAGQGGTTPNLQGMAGGEEGITEPMSGSYRSTTNLVSYFLDPYDGRGEI
jgi:hypothetical protein